MEIGLKDLLKKDLRDEVIVFQTDTVYGVGCLLDSAEGVERIFRLKRRERSKPLAVLCADRESLETLVRLNPTLDALARMHWPGPLTCIAEKTERVPDSVTRGLRTVGVRIPADATASAILRRFGPMAVTSLNLSGEDEVLTYENACQFLAEVDVVVKGGDLSGPASTVVDTIHRKTLREGAVDVDWSRVR